MSNARQQGAKQDA